jgi:hypothetical protein
MTSPTFPCHATRGPPLASAADRALGMLLDLSPSFLPPPAPQPFASAT